MSNKTDEELYSELLGGGREGAFRVLYARHSGPLFRFLYRFTLDRPLTEEILQDIFEQLLVSRLEMNSRLNIKSWLYTLAKNRSLNLIKKTSREIKNELIVENASSTHDMAQEFEYENLLDRLASAEKKLPMDLSKTWQLRKDGMDYQQIAEVLSIPVGTVKSRFSRLVEFLKKEFAS